MRTPCHAELDSASRVVLFPNAFHVVNLIVKKMMAQTLKHEILNKISSGKFFQNERSNFSKQQKNKPPCHAELDSASRAVLFHSAFHVVNLIVRKNDSSNFKTGDSE